MSILVTGATGFIGQNLLRYLLSKNEKVICIVRFPQKISSLQGCKNLSLIEADPYDNGVLKKIDDGTVKSLIHLIGALGDWGAKEENIYYANVDLVNEALVFFNQSNIKNFVYLSTPGVQGFGHKKAKESEPYNPRYLYEQTKADAEINIINYPYNKDKNWVIIRPDFVFGPGDYRRLKLYRRIKKRLWFHIGKGSAVIRPTYVMDVCRAIYYCHLKEDLKSEIFNVAGPELLTVNEYVQQIAHAVNVKLLPFRLPEPFIMSISNMLEHISKITHTAPLIKKSQVEFLTQDHGTDISKIEKYLSFCPVFSFKDGIKETVSWAEKNNLL